MYLQHKCNKIYKKDPENESIQIEKQLTFYNTTKKFYIVNSSIQNVSH